MEQDWEKYQIEKEKYIIKTDTFDKDKIKYIAGLDISFHKFNSNIGCAYITIYDINKQEIIYEDHEICNLTVPYVSGFLAFREIEHYSLLLKRLKINSPELYPDVIMIDGFGILHHRGFGSASHFGYEFDIPTIGVGKTLLFIDGLNEKEIKNKCKEICKIKGDAIKLIGDSGKEYGVALKTADNVENPLYVSIGHKISLETAVELVLKTSKFRIPEPIRNSNIKSKKFFYEY